MQVKMRKLIHFKVSFESLCWRPQQTCWQLKSANSRNMFWLIICNLTLNKPRMWLLNYKKSTYKWTYFPDVMQVEVRTLLHYFKVYFGSLCWRSLRTCWQLKSVNSWNMFWLIICNLTLNKERIWYIKFSLL